MSESSSPLPEAETESLVAAEASNLVEVETHGSSKIEGETLLATGALSLGLFACFMVAKIMGRNKHL